jgi:methionyl-tRNA formyltransferase
MENQDFRILFMGTPDFAVESLKTLKESGKNIIAVVTAPDKPAGRGRELNESAVKKYALANKLPVLQPLKLKDPEFLSQVLSLKPSLIVVVAFRMLPKTIWEIPPYGTINLHASLLPQYRGAAPINWAIINGEDITGVTTFLIEEEIDTGKILMQKEVCITETENAGTLHDKLAAEGADLLNETVDKLMKKELQATAQQSVMKNYAVLHPAPKIFRETCRIEWNKPLINIHNHIRGLSPVPAAWTELMNEEGSISPVKIFETKPENSNHSLPVGKILTDGKTYLKVACQGGFLQLLNLQIPGKKPLAVTEFLKGFRLGENAGFK